jgi:AAA domain
MDLRAIARALGGEVRGGQVLCPGPGHSTTDRSLSVRLDPSAPGGILVHSFSGDDPITCKDYVRQKCALPAFGNGNGRPRRTEAEIERAVLGAIKGQQGPAHVSVRYSYTDADGTLLYEVERLEPKSFRARRPDGDKWIYSLNGFDRRVVYRLPDLVKYPDATVFLCEGEKDADRVADLGHCATTVAFGTWTQECIEALANRDVLILEDADAAGHKKAIAAAKACHGTAKTIRIVRLPGLTGEKDNKDVSDWLDADPQHARTFVDVCFDVPVWEPPAEGEDETPPNTEQPPAAEPPPTAETPPPKSRPRKFTLVRFDAVTIGNEPVYLVGGLIPRAGLSIVWGAPKCGKSFFTFDLAMNIALGRDYRARRVQQGPVIYLALEGGAGFNFASKPSAATTASPTPHSS